MSPKKIINLNEMEKEPLSEEIKMNEKYCVDCKTTKTPLWRSGPAGPKSLCNACGIKQRKKSKVTTHQVVDSTSSKQGKVCGDLRGRVMALGKEVILPKQRCSKKRQRKRNTHSNQKFGEVEQAAVLLMAMSSGSVFV